MRDRDFLDQFERVGPPAGAPMARWIVLGGVILGLWVLTAVATNVYTDLLWFQEVGYVSVFLEILSTKVLLFIAGAILFAVILLVNVFLARRFSPQGEDVIPPPSIPMEAVVWLRQLLGLGILAGTALLAIVFGLAAANIWEQALRFWYSVPFGLQDPLYQQDVSFYVFSLPFYRFVQGWLLGAVIVSVLVSLGIYAVNFALGGFRFQFTPAIRGHLSGLTAIFFLLLAWGYWFDIYELVFGQEGAAYGAGYTAVNARLWAYRLLIGVAVLAALVLVYNIFRRSLRLPLFAIGLWVAALALGEGLYPALVQRFQVEPDEFSLEKQYITNTINMTRRAYALDRIDIRPHEVRRQFTAEHILDNPLTVNNVRLWDHRPLRSVYKQIQFFELYYDFNDIDVDRYVVDGQYRQTMIGARELTGPPPNARTWVNQKLQFTHGYSVAMSPATEFTEKGEPEFFIKDIPPAGVVPVARPQIYYGELTNDYVIVKTSERELDHPSEAGPVYSSYEGAGGIPLGSFLNRLLFAWRLGDLNLLISGAVQPESQLLFIRQIRERVEHIAPFLSLDRDPYMVVTDEGRLVWVQDAYTHTNHFPYSEPISPNVNYIRNSVKVVVDAYDGTVQFYIADETDGIIKTYATIFPNLFKPFSEMPSVIREHLRYPQDFFEFQAQMFLKYHMTEPQTFYNQEDLWARPRETFEGVTIPMEPYYVMMRLPGEEKEEFILILPFTPFNKPNLAGWMAARNDGEHYGTLLAFAFQAEGRVGQIDGPEQVEASIASNREISGQFTLWRGSSAGGEEGVTVLQGNLLVIPIGDTVIYVEPIYLEPKNIELPSLTAVVVVSQGKEPVLEGCLSRALARLVGQDISCAEAVALAPSGGAATPAPPSSTLLRQELRTVQEALARLRAQLDELAQALQRVADLVRAQEQ